MTDRKTVLERLSAPSPHWVGNGFPVRSLFSYPSLGRKLSPFLLLDHAGPASFPGDGARRGVGEHPHRGFETVTIVYSGEVAHRDSTGKGGVIGPGDVQWMTAAGGILHEEYHSPAFSAKGGELEMVQLWVNLPAAAKMSDPGYQAIESAQIPQLALPQGTLRVIAGDYEGTRGPARTHTPLNVWDLRLSAGGRLRLPVPQGHQAAVVVLRGTVLVNDEDVLRDAQLAVFGGQGEGIDLEANNDALVLILSGEPIDEPIVGHGPFVMNTREEILQAFQDFETGRFIRAAAR